MSTLRNGQMVCAEGRFRALLPTRKTQVSATGSSEAFCDVMRYGTLAHASHTHETPVLGGERLTVLRGYDVSH
jgi:hypothetical protein